MGLTIGIRRRVGAVLAILATVLLVAAPTVQAGTTFIAFACEEHLIAQTAESTCWIDEDGVLHCRGFAADYAFVGSPECAGTGHAVANFNLDLLTGEGSLWGTNHLELTAVQGGYDLQFTSKWTNPFPLADDATDIWAGRFWGHGYGDRDGWQIRGFGIERTHVLVEDWGQVFLPGS